MMRVYGRVPANPLYPDGPKVWKVVTTDPNGFNDQVHLTAMAQTYKLNLAESPFWANYGIPGHESVMQQIFPTYYVIFIQQFYSQFFAVLSVAQLPTADPQYRVDAITHAGVKLGDLRIKGGVPT